MSFNMNDAMRQRGNRSRRVAVAPPIPNIGQSPNVAPPPAAPPTPPAPPMMPQQPQAPAPGPSQVAQPPVMAPPPVMGRPENPIMPHPPGTPANIQHYNYEPRPNGGWMVYPPGVAAPDDAFTVSTPRAASTNDYGRMRQAFQRPPGF